MYMAVLPYWHKNAGDRLGTNGIPEKMQPTANFGAALREAQQLLDSRGDSTAKARPVRKSSTSPIWKRRID